jgi:hypothetical protein
MAGKHAKTLTKQQLTAALRRALLAVARLLITRRQCSPPLRIPAPLGRVPICPLRRALFPADPCLRHGDKPAGRCAAPPGPFSLSHRSARRQPTMIKEVRFAPDSALEGDGFEPSVPRRGQHFSRPPRNPARTNWPESQNRILTMDKGRFIVRRARLAPAMISTPGHRAS